MTPPAKGKPKYNTKRAWAEARALIWEHRTSVSVGLALMVVSRAAGFVLPYSTKNVFDVVLDASTETVATADGSVGTPTAAAFVAFAFMEAAIQNGGLCGVCVFACSYT